MRRPGLYSNRSLTQSLHKTKRILGVCSSLLITVLLVVYLIVLALGLMSLPSPVEPIGNPYFTMMELLILLLVPLVILMMVAVHSISPAGTKTLSMAALVFMAMMGCTTSMVHFTILVLNPYPAFQAMPLLLAFEWPSVVYALDILAWDVFFAFAVILAGFVFEEGKLALSIRFILWLSGILALIGLAGIPTADMQIRNIGILGYTVVFAIATALIAVFFYRMPVDP